MTIRKGFFVLFSMLLIALLFTYVFPLSDYSIFKSEGQKLAEKHCASCHLYPEPGLLDKITWTSSVIPEMAFLMGFPSPKHYNQLSPEDREIVMRQIPSEPMISRSDLQAITRFYQEEAPLHLSGIRPAAYSNQTQFNAKKPAQFNGYFVTLLQYDSIHQQTYVGTRQQWLYQLNDQFVTVDSIKLAGSPSSIAFEEKRLLVSLMGIFDPNDQKAGKIVELNYELDSVRTIVDQIQRPTFLRTVDLDGDQQREIIVCEFGNYTGGLNVYNLENGRYVKHAISLLPGARNFEIRDLDLDGDLDLVALLTQSNEQIIAFYNRGDLRFEEKPLLQFSPVFGSSYFELIDMDQDGDEDMLYTNGDNGDKSYILKPYHSIKVFTNNGNFEFEEAYQYPMYGASMAKANDFDADGDMDILAISYFPDFFNSKDHGILYLENLGNFNFQPQIEAIAEEGRWLVMEMADVNRDNHLDVLVGSCSFRGLGANAEIFRFWRSKATPLLIFENNQ